MQTSDSPINVCQLYVIFTGLIISQWTYNCTVKLSALFYVL